METESVIGWDLGGAHLKAARLDGTGTVERVMQVPCQVWQGIEHLDRALEQVLTAFGPAPIHAVTMTGEMADLFANRTEGVVRLVGALRERTAGALLRCYAGTYGFVDVDQVSQAARHIASANWRASATVIAAAVPEALFVDVGSTTTDLVVVRNGRVCSAAGDDAQRLLAGELLYTGVVRTPVMALATAAPFDGDWIPLMAEQFATAADVHRLTGHLPEAADQHPAADGGPKTVAGSARRLARMIGRDAESAPLPAWQRLAAWLARAQARRLEDAWDRALSREPLADDAPVVVAGVGRFVVAALARVRGRPIIEFGCLLPVHELERDRATDSAPAVAVAWLARPAAVTPVPVGGAPRSG
ncbi:MAG TPA: hydantoinase/oxoprolinase family protein [Gemmatimonadales bacterium]|nr:hydantoinase/oxoprolinase family protein [Gemmatimonadales bacterium]